VKALAGQPKAEREAALAAVASRSAAVANPPAAAAVR